MSKNVTIVGAGLVGSLWAAYCAKRGYNVEVFERRPDVRKTGGYGGKSINLALSDRGWKALEGVGLGAEIRKMAIPMHKRIMHAVDGTITEQAYGKEGQAIYSVSRGGLNERLMDLAEQSDKVKITFDSKCTGVDFNTGTTTFDHKGEHKSVESDVVFGTDGAFSAVRAAMQKTSRFNYSQEYIDHGYKELNIPPNEDGSHRLETEALHIWPRGGYMLIALPNLDGSFTCTLFFPYEGKDSFESLDTTEKATAFFKETFADAYDLMPTFEQDWEENPTAPLVIIRCAPWTKNGKVALMGDASHAIVPFYGQGMNSGFEDCTILNQLLEEMGDSDMKSVLEAYQTERTPNGNAIADLAMRNFVEMRDLTANPRFLLRKKIEAKISKKHPEKWLPLYSMVTFSHIPYHKALAIGQKQDDIMEAIMDRPDIKENWDSQEVEDAILAQANF